MKKNKFLTITFLIIIFSLFIYLPIKFILLEINVITLDYSNFKTAPIKEGTDVITKFENKFNNIKTNIENRVTNYFPFYSLINYNYAKLNKLINEKKGFTFIDMNTNNEYIFSNNEFYVLESSLNEKELKSRFEKQLDFYKQMNEIIPVYIYLPNRYEFTGLDEDIRLRDKEKYIEELKLHLNVKELEIKDNAEYTQYFYRTDHHWNSYGAIKGYEDIIEMLGYKPKKLTAKMLDVDFIGSTAKAAALTNIKDYFTIIDYESNIKINIEGYKPKKIKETKDVFYDHYVSYYNGMFGEIIYKNDKNKENLLIISDSFAWPIDEIIASHFKNTHVINVRYDRFINENLNFKKYIKDNKIDKVLVLGETQSTLFDAYNYDTKRKILGD